MRTNGIITAGALALLMGCQLLVTALPALDYMWSRINTERYFASTDDCNLDEDCLWPPLSNSAIGSHEHQVPRVREPAVVYPPDTHAVPAATATATAFTSIIATPSPCNHQEMHSTTTPASIPYIELQRRDDALEEIPPSLTSMERKANATPKPSAPLTFFQCGIGPCPPFFSMLDRGICLCMGPFVPKTKAVE